MNIFLPNNYIKEHSTVEYRVLYIKRIYCKHILQVINQIGVRNIIEN